MTLSWMLVVVLLQVTYQNSANQNYLLAYKDAVIAESLLK